MYITLIILFLSFCGLISESCAEMRALNTVDNLGIGTSWNQMLFNVRPDLLIENKYIKVGGYKRIVLVTRSDDSEAAGTIRYAFNTAQEGDIIKFSPGLIIELTSNLTLTTPKNITIIGDAKNPVLFKGGFGIKFIAPENCLIANLAHDAAPTRGSSNTGYDAFTFEKPINCVIAHLIGLHSTDCNIDVIPTRGNSTLRGRGANSIFYGLINFKCLNEPQYHYERGQALYHSKGSLFGGDKMRIIGSLFAYNADRNPKFTGQDNSTNPALASSMENCLIVGYGFNPTCGDDGESFVNVRGNVYIPGKYTTPEIGYAFNIITNEDHGAAALDEAPFLHLSGNVVFDTNGKIRVVTSQDQLVQPKQGRLITQLRDPSTGRPRWAPQPFLDPTDNFRMVHPVAPNFDELSLPEKYRYATQVQTFVRTVAGIPTAEPGTPVYQLQQRIWADVENKAGSQPYIIDRADNPAISTETRLRPQTPDPSMQWWSPTSGNTTPSTPPVPTPGGSGGNTGGNSSNSGENTSDGGITPSPSIPLSTGFIVTTSRDGQSGSLADTLRKAPSNASTTISFKENITPSINGPISLVSKMITLKNPERTLIQIIINNEPKIELNNSILTAENVSLTHQISTNKSKKTTPPDTYLVTQSRGSGQGTLEYALKTMRANTLIQFAPNLNEVTITTPFELRDKVATIAGKVTINFQTNNPTITVQNSTLILQDTTFISKMSGNVEF